MTVATEGTRFPAPKLPEMISGRFPPLRRPDDKTAESGKVRLGDCMITAPLPPHR
jgi:hypothetical protein